MSLPPSEYGGKTLPNGYQPEVPEAVSPNGQPVQGGHTLTPSEKLSLIYRTGQEEDPTMDRQPGAFQGNLPAQRE